MLELVLQVVRHTDAWLKDHSWAKFQQLVCSPTYVRSAGLHSTHASEPYSNRQKKPPTMV